MRLPSLSVPLAFSSPLRIRFGQGAALNTARPETIPTTLAQMQESRSSMAKRVSGAGRDSLRSGGDRKTSIAIAGTVIKDMAKRMVRRRTLRFNNPSQEREFLSGYFAVWNIAALRPVLAMILLFWIIVAVTILRERSVVLLVLPPLLALMGIGTTFWQRLPDSYVRVFAALWVAILAYQMFFVLTERSGTAAFAVLTPLLAFVALPLPFPVACAVCAMQVVLFLIGVLFAEAPASVDPDGEMLLLPAHLILLGAICGLGCFLGYQTEHQMRETFLLDFVAAQGRQSGKVALHNMLPPFVADGILLGKQFHEFTRALDDVLTLCC